MEKIKSYFKPLKYIFLMLIFSLGCTHNKVERGDALSSSNIAFIKSLGLLDNDEKICQFYSEYKNGVAGNFFTNKRIATYWIDPRKKSKNSIESVFYNDVMSIDIVYYAGATNTPYAKITSKNGTIFKVSVNGDRNTLKNFFEEMSLTWKKKVGKIH